MFDEEQEGSFRKRAVGNDMGIGAGHPGDS